MRIFTHLITLLIAVLLASCGGGGGSAGLPSNSASTFTLIAPAAVTMEVGTTQQYNITGGVKPYTVFSTVPAAVTGWLIGDSVVAIGAIAQGNGQISVQDAKGTRSTIVVTIGSNATLSSTIPSAITLAPGPFGSQTYKVSGGIPPYKVTSNNPSVVSAVVNGTDLTITALQLPGSATITIQDSAGTPAIIQSLVTTGTITLAVNPSTTTMPGAAFCAQSLLVARRRTTPLSWISAE